jgi:anti-anti-sigma regulatory factor
VVAASTSHRGVGPRPDVCAAVVRDESAAARTGHTELRLRGRPHDALVTELREHLADLVAGGERHIVVRAEEQHELDLAVLQALHAMSAHLASRGGSLVLLGAQPRVRTVIAIHGLSTLLPADPASGDPVPGPWERKRPSPPAVEPYPAEPSSRRPVRPRHQRPPAPQHAAVLSPVTRTDSDVHDAPLAGRRTAAGSRG